MARQILACVFLLSLTSAKEQTRWSRQISSYTSDLSDWVPLPGPIEPPAPQLPQIKRQAVAEPRILAEPVFPGFQRPTGFSQDFPARTFYNPSVNRQLYLQSIPSVPSAPQNFLSDQGFSQGIPQIHQPHLQQGIRFGLSQPNFPLNQGFVGPQFTFDSVPQPKHRPQLISNPISFPKTNLPAPAQVKPFINQAPKKAEIPKFIDGYRAENVSSFQSMKRPQSLQKLKYDTFDKVPKTEMVPPKPKSEREEVQLLYVPLEQLNRGQFNFRSSLTQSQVINSDTFGQNQRLPLPNPAPPKQTFAADFQRPVAKPLDTFDQDYFSNFNSYKNIDQIPKFSTISTPFPTTLSTTPKPKKLKPHQPPLAIFLAQEAKKGSQVKVSDVLSSLKNADSVAVLDSVNPLTAPKVFIGPSNLSPPDSFVKFELPYLSNIDHSDKKLRQLPFFVAPLSYNTPQGFAKIPFPSPHVGSVVINSQIKDTTTTLPTHIADISPNSYSTSPQSYKQEQRKQEPSQKPSVSFYTTSAPKTNAPLNHQSNYYSFEPQTVSTLRPPKEPQASIVSQPKPGSYFLSNDQYSQDQYNAQAPPNFNVRNSFKTQEPVKAFNVAKTEPTTTTVSSTTAKSSTYPSQLLETHNPYSINQAFHFSTPLDYHNLFEETYATPGFPQQPSQPSPPTSSVNTVPSSTHKPVEPVTEKNYQTSPNYLQNNYSPEIHYESELTNVRYPVTNTNDYTTKTEAKPEYNQPIQSNSQENTNSFSSSNSPVEYNGNVETQAPIQNPEYVQNTQTQNNANTEQEISSKTPYYQYETSYEQEKQTSPTTSTTTTTRRTPLRTRGRPRYTTTPKADSGESTTRTVVTRRPLRERRPLPPRTRYEPNKITTERATRKPVDSGESTTKYSRGRTRGRVHYKPSDSDDYNGKFNSKQSSSKEADLAYQRDVLHQNYPVTLMERSSTVDIEAITEPVPKISSTKNLEPATEVYDTDNAYSYDRAVSQHISNSNSKEEVDTQNSEAQTETYVPKYSSSREDYTYQSRSSFAPAEPISQYEELVEKDEESFVRQTTPSYSYSTKNADNSYATEPSSSVTEQSPSSYSISDLSSKSEEVPTTADIEITKSTSRETTPQQEEEENIVQTTPSYNRVRVRPGVIRQYQQTSTDSSRTKTDRRRPSQPVTYRPAYSGRRTTMRIDEIEADLKTKPVHARPEQEYRHPVYKPDPSTEPSATTSSSQESTTKRGVFRRRRPSHVTTSTESQTSATTKRTYEIKNRFRGRRPTTEKASTEKPEVQTDASTTTVRNTIYSRYTRPRLSERFNKKPEPEESEDQDSNYSILKPKYAEPETDQWSPNISTDSFKPYNPNDIIEDKKATTPTPGEELDIITAKNNDYDDILLTVTPASNTRDTKKVPDIPPTLEALVEQSKVTKGDTGDNMSTFESMLEQVMKSLEEQDEDEYTSKVMKHKGGEIGEIPPERIISSGDNYAKATTIEEHAVTTIEPAIDEVTTHSEDEKHSKSHRRGFWKKVKVRPVTTESIEAAESQYYVNTVNRLGHPVNPSKSVHDKTYNEKTKVTTYKPTYQFLKDIFDDADEDFIPNIEIAKVKNVTNNSVVKDEKVTAETNLIKDTPAEAVPNPGDMDLGTGTPDPTIESIATTTPESTTKVFERSDGFSFMDYIFGVTSEDESHGKRNDSNKPETEKAVDVEIATEQTKPSLPTTESSYIPEEITTVASDEGNIETTIPEFDIKKVNVKQVNKTDDKVVENTEKYVKAETSSVSSFMDPNNVVSTSMSTEISHETEICFRGKCIKTKDVNL